VKYRYAVALDTPQRAAGRCAPTRLLGIGSWTRKVPAVTWRRLQRNGWAREQTAALHKDEVVTR